MKSTNGPIYFSMILVTVLLFCLMYAIYDEHNIEPINKPVDNVSSSSEQIDITYNWDGVYNKSDNSLTLSIYKIDDDTLAIVNKLSGTLVYLANIINSKYIFISI